MAPKPSPESIEKMDQNGIKKVIKLARGKAETGELGCFGLLWAALAYFRLQWAA